MKRRNFLKSCLGGLCLPVLVTTKVKPKSKKITLYTPSNERSKFGLNKLNRITVKYSGKSQVSPDEAMIWCEDGTVCKAVDKFAGVAVCDI